MPTYYIIFPTHVFPEHPFDMPTFLCLVDTYPSSSLGAALMWEIAARGTDEVKSRTVWKAGMDPRVSGCYPVSTEHIFL